jgi:site-specific recombinase XerD
MSSLAGVVAAYLDHLEAEVGASAHTVAAYRRDLGRYAGWLEAQGVSSIAEVEAEHVAAFAAVAAVRGCVPSRSGGVLGGAWCRSRPLAA